MGIPQRVLDNLEDKLIKDMLNGKSESDAKQEIATRIGRPVDDPQVTRIYKQARNKSGLDYKVYEKSGDNATVRQAQINEIVSSGITRIEQGGDNEEIINDVEDKLKKMNLSEQNVQNYLMQIYNHFDHETKPKDQDEFLLKEGEELIPLPMVDVDYDELQNINLPEDEEEGVLPPVDKDLLTQQNLMQARKYQSLKTEGEKEKFRENIFRTEGKLVQETKKLEDYIRQVKICCIIVPIVFSKLRMEDLLIKFLQRVEDKFRNIYVFGWEKQVNTEFYKSFDELFKMNDENEGALFIIRDIKTFNVYAVDLFKFGITRNYFIVLADGIVRKDDLIPIDNLTNGNAYLWPAFADLEVRAKLAPTKCILYGKHAEAYLGAIKRAYPKPYGKESWSSMQDNPAVITIGRKVLTLDLTMDDISGRTTGTNLISLTNPPLNLEEAISRSPKFRDMIISIFANSGDRILVKLGKGESGLEGFVYIYEKLKKRPIQPTIVRWTDDYNSKRGKIKSVPDIGPCLVITDFTLTDQLIPRNIDKFYISGGGEKEDVDTIFDLSKVINYTRNKFPRTIEIKNFLGSLEGGIPVTIDEIEYEAFENLIVKDRENRKKLKSRAIQIINMPGERFGVREPDV
jgi:hypothetical protein